MKIEDGTGKGYELEIDSDNHAHVRAFIQEMAYWAAHKQGRSFTWTIVPYNYAALDTIILVRNDNADLDLIMTDIWICSDAATDAIVHYTDGAAFTPAGTAVVGVNSNRKSSIPALATAMADETANTQGNIALQLPLVANQLVHIDTKGAVILGYHNCVAVDYPTVGTMAWAAMAGYYSEQI